VALVLFEDLWGTRTAAPDLWSIKSLLEYFSGVRLLVLPYCLPTIFSLGKGAGEKAKDVNVLK
jgi:hypothetical protein